MPVTEQELKGKKKKDKEIEKASKSGDEKDGEKSACEGKVWKIFQNILIIHNEDVILQSFN